MQIEKQQLMCSSPDWVLPSVDIIDYSLFEENYDGVKYGLYEEQIYLHDGVIEYYTKAQKKIIARQGIEQAAVLPIDFHPDIENVTIAAVYVDRNDTRINLDELVEAEVYQREESLEARILNGMHTLTLLIGGVKVDDILTVEFIRTIKAKSAWEHFNYIFSENRFGFVYHRKLSIITKKQDNYLITPIKGELPFQKEIVRENIIYHVASLNKAVKPLEYHMTEYDMASNMLQFTRAATWRDLANEYASIYSGRTLEDSDATEFLQKLIEDGASTSEKALSVINYIKEHIRYFSNDIGHDHTLPVPPDLSLRRGYADCKGMVLLATTMLSKLNIESFPLLVTEKNSDFLDNIAPSIACFDHVILGVVLDDETVYVDLTEPVSFELLTLPLLGNYNKALSCKTGEMTLISLPDEFKSIIHRQDIIVGPKKRNDSTDITVKLRYTGVIAMSAIVDYLQKGTYEYTEERLSQDFPLYEDAKLLSVKVDVESFKKREFAVEIKASYPERLYARTKGKFYLGSYLLYGVLPPELPEVRLTDLSTGAMVELTHEIRIIEQNLKLKKDRHLEVSEEYQSFMVRLEKETDRKQLLYRYYYKDKENVIKKDDYKQYRTAVLKARDKHIVLVDMNMLINTAATRFVIAVIGLILGIIIYSLSGSVKETLLDARYPRTNAEFLSKKVAGTEYVRQWNKAHANESDKSSD